MKGVTVVGVRGHLVAVEAHVGRGLPSLTLTGRFDVVLISMDARWGDFGERGHVEIRSRPSEPLVEDYPPLAASASGSSIREELDAFDREIEEHTFAHGVVARAGGYVAGDWEYGSSHADRELLQAVRSASWSADAWEFLVTNRT